MCDGETCSAAMSSLFSFGGNYMSLRKGLTWLLALACMSPFAAAQDRQAEQPSKVDIFTGYSYLDPGGKLNGTKLKSVPEGFNISTSYFLNKYGGVTLDGSGHFGDSVDMSTLSFGPIVRIPMDQVTPFAHAMIGWNRLGLTGIGDDNGLDLIAGGGLDLHVLPRVSFRLFQADYIYSHHHFPNP